MRLTRSLTARRSFQTCGESVIFVGRRSSSMHSPRYRLQKSVHPIGAAADEDVGASSTGVVPPPLAQAASATTPKKTNAAHTTRRRITLTPGPFSPNLDPKRTLRKEESSGAAVEKPRPPRRAIPEPVWQRD